MENNNLKPPNRHFHRFLIKAYKKPDGSKIAGNSPLDIPNRTVFLSFCASIITALIIGNIFIICLHASIGTCDLPEIEEKDIILKNNNDTTEYKISKALVNVLLPHLASKAEDLDKELKQKLSERFKDNKITVSALEKMIQKNTTESSLKELVIGDLKWNLLLMPYFDPLSPDKIADELELFKDYQNQSSKANWERLIFISGIQYIRNKLDNGITHPRRLLMALGGTIQWVTFITAIWCLILLLLLRSPWITLQDSLVSGKYLPWHNDSTTRDVWNINDPYFAELDLNENYPGSFVTVRLIKDVINISDSDKTLSIYTAIRERIEAYRNSIEIGEYEIINFLIWATPTFGFIGTIFGIISAMENAAAIFSAADPIAQAVALDTVSTALGTAFDTSFIALIWLVPMSFFLAKTRKKEANLFERLEYEGIANLPPQLQKRNSN